MSNDVKRTLVIAEAGVNHNGQFDLALKLVDAAADAGADVVKFQVFQAESLVSKSAQQAEYQVKNTGRNESQYQMLKKLELSYEEHGRVAEYCQIKGVEYLSTPFDSHSLRFLAEELQLETLKVPSGDLTNAPLLLEFARSGKKLIVSTGMATLADIEAALSVLAWGMLNPDGSPDDHTDFGAAYFSVAGRELLAQKVILLHCTTEYPAPFEDVNLTAMQTMSQAFRLPCGYSDHTQGIAVPLAAVALGAVVIEKHFTLSRDMEGPDHKASLEPSELKEMISAIREVEVSIGDGVKGPRPSEIANMPVARKSLTAAKSIEAGSIFCEADFVIMRPGSGTSPFQFWKLIGKPSRKAYEAGELIDE
jgi:N-acetylneuraminate synthase